MFFRSCSSSAYVLAFVVVFVFPFDITLGGGCVGFGGDCGGAGGEDEEDAPVSAGAALDGFGAAFAFADGFGAALDGFGAAVDGLTFAGAGGGGGGGADEGDASISSGVSLAFFLVVFFLTFSVSLPLPVGFTLPQPFPVPLPLSLGGAAFWAVVSDIAMTSCFASLYFFSVPVMSCAFVRFCAIAGPTMSNALAAALTFFGVGPAAMDSVGIFGCPCSVLNLMLVVVVVVALVLFLPPEGLSLMLLVF